MYNHFLDAEGLPRCLLIAPNAPAVAALKRSLLAASPASVIISPAVTTFAALARRLLAAAGRTGRIASPFQQRVLLRQIVDQLAESGKLPVLKPVV